MNKNIKILLSLAVITTGIFGSIASISAGWGMVGILISIILSLFILILCVLLLMPMIQKNDRGVTLLQAINGVGMVDIENREDLTSPLPPEKFYQKALHEIVITGISAYRTFDQHLDILKECINSGKKIYVLIMHPKSKVLDNLSKVEGKNVSGDINEVIRVIKEANLQAHPGFTIRFRDELPPFTGVMIDGDLTPTGEKPRDQKGQIRVQPASAHRSQHRGIILQFQKKQKSQTGAFDFFADDLRNQWKFDAQEDKILFS